VSLQIHEQYSSLPATAVGAALIYVKTAERGAYAASIKTICPVFTPAYN